MRKISRRDFMKVAGAAVAGTVAANKLSFAERQNDLPNIVIIVMDTLSARHMSLHGYLRQTTPNIDSFADSATVYHHHYSSGNFTTTGTASMLTGMLPWKHRAINYGGLIKSDFVKVNPFALLGNSYKKTAFTQNPWADRLLGQYFHDVDRLLSPLSYSYAIRNKAISIYNADHALESVALSDFLFSIDGLGNPPGLPALGYLTKSRLADLSEKLVTNEYPKGMPDGLTGISYSNEEVYAGVASEIMDLAGDPPPFFGYFHLYSPHAPYKPRNEYRKLFNDGYIPPSKPEHPFSYHLTDEYLSTRQVMYDQQIAHVDNEFGKLVSKLKQAGILDNSYVILTSDHGELFERGFQGHGDHLMYEGVLRIPLLIHTPGQTSRNDIHSLTSNTDLIPTLLKIGGKDQLAGIDGKLLPGFGGDQNSNRSIISILGMDNAALAPIKKAVFSMRKENFKLIAYLGYDKLDREFELYDLENDEDELDDLSSRDTKVVTAMKQELYDNLNDANKHIP